MVLVRVAIVDDCDDVGVVAVVVAVAAVVVDFAAVAL